MTTDIKIANPGQEVLLEMRKWLQDNIGPGSMRTIKHSFMGMDDWFFKYELIDNDEMELDDFDDDDDGTENLIFTFRRETDATMFALKWTTQITN
jgi:hypothetical protein